MNRVTVIMGSYNGERFIEQSVRSVLAQTYTEFDFVILDDGSTDSAPDILRRLHDTDRRIRLVQRQSGYNRGLSQTANEMLAEVRTPLVVNIDHDDVMRPDCLATLVAYMDEHPECAACSGNMDVIDERGVVTHQPRAPQGRVVYERETFPFSFPYLAHPGACFRTEKLREIGGYRDDLTIAVDFDMWLRLAEVGELHRLDAVLVDYRWHGSNTTASKAWQNQACAIVWQLSALARHRRVDDRWLLKNFRDTNDLHGTIAAYARAIGDDRVASHALLYAVRVSMSPLSENWTSRPRLLMGVVAHALRAPWRSHRVWVAWWSLSRFAALAVYRRIEGKPRAMAAVAGVRAAVRRLRLRSLAGVMRAAVPARLTVVVAGMALLVAFSLHATAIAAGAMGFGTLAAKGLQYASVLEVMPLWIVIGNGLTQVAQHVCNVWDNVSDNVSGDPQPSPVLMPPKIAQNMPDPLNAYAGDSMAEHEHAQRRTLRSIKGGLSS